MSLFSMPTIEPTDEALANNYVDTSCLNQEKANLFWQMENTNNTMFITGKAGSGKSYLLDFFVKETRKNVAIAAPTGIAALNVNGQTIHSLFRLELDVQNPESIRRKGVFGKQKTVLKNIDTLVIDEASMVRVDILDAIDLKLQLANGNNKPFGGKQVILFGDLYQLPPIADAQVNRYLKDKYGSTFFYAAPVFKRLPLEVYELDAVYRQHDDAFINILNKIRTGNATSKDLDVINKQYSAALNNSALHSNYITITPRKETASRINQQKLNMLSTQQCTYNAIIEGDFAKSNYPTEQQLNLKVGAQVMMLVNDTASDYQESGNKGRRWVNGTIGTITELGEDFIEVKINGVNHIINQYEWERIEYEYNADEKKLIAKPIASFRQFPVKLAWALTVHKAQGQTYEYVSLDLDGHAFEAGQTYVALSRCVSLENIRLSSPICTQDIIVNQEIVKLMNELKNNRNKNSKIHICTHNTDASIDDHINNGSIYIHTNEDFVKDSQRYWVSYEIDMQTQNEIANNESSIKNAPEYSYEYEPQIDWKEYNYVTDEDIDNGYDEWHFENLIENRVPEGWPETFYEY